MAAFGFLRLRRLDGGEVGGGEEFRAQGLKPGARRQRQFLITGERCELVLRRIRRPDESDPWPPYRARSWPGEGGLLTAAVRRLENSLHDDHDGDHGGDEADFGQARVGAFAGEVAAGIHQHHEGDGGEDDGEERIVRRLSRRPARTAGTCRWLAGSWLASAFAGRFRVLRRRPRPIWCRRVSASTTAIPSAKDSTKPTMTASQFTLAVSSCMWFSSGGEQRRHLVHDRLPAHAVVLTGFG